MQFHLSLGGADSHSAYELLSAILPTVQAGGDRWLADWRFARCLWEADRRGKAALFWLFVGFCGWHPKFWNWGG